MNSTIKFAPIVFLVVTISSQTLEAQIGNKCDTNVVLSTQNKAGKLTSKDVKAFLYTFGKECSNNVEFSEFSNEVLFQIIDKQTDLVLRTMANEESRLEMEAILSKLSSPINDSINIKELISKVDRIEMNGELRKKVLERLKIAESHSH
ncbi:MAG: hypothetical protein JNL40_02275 [Cyclobacteriaceae bacterium]|nr:hypothetical protein [Cyclobacteriaceae bacterium]